MIWEGRESLDRSALLGRHNTVNMPTSELRLIKRMAEFRPRGQIELEPHGLRGIYVLLKHRSETGKYDIVYVGMARSGIQGRLRVHARSKRKRKLWTHFSLFAVWDNIRNDEIAELEGILRHIYRKDTQANSLNKQRGFKPLRRIRVNNLRRWQ